MPSGPRGSDAIAPPPFLCQRRIEWKWFGVFGLVKAADFSLSLMMIIILACNIAARPEC